MTKAKHPTPPAQVPYYPAGSPIGAAVNTIPGNAASAVQSWIALARVDPNAFMEYVIRDELTGNRIRQATHHRAWQDLLRDHTDIVLWAAVEHAKTTQISVGRVLWELGRNPNLRVAIISNTKGQATKVCRLISRYIELSDALHEVFPKLLPGSVWTTQELIVDRPIAAKDPSVQTCGIHGNIQGSRIDLVIMDDVLDYENTRTAHGRQELHDWYLSAVAGRLTKDARQWVIGTAFHPDDLLHRMAKQQGWAAYRFPAMDEATGAIRWPERWPLERLNKWRDKNGPLEFARQLMCRARDDSESRFKREWIDKCKARGKEPVRMEVSACFRDIHFGLPRYLERVPNGYKTVTGVDLAVQQTDAADSTVLFTMLVYPDGSRHLLQIESGKWAGPDIVSRIIDAHRRYQSLVIVENVAAQDFILQFTRAQAAIPMRPFTTGRNKAHPEFGVESLAAEMANGKWIIPCTPKGRCSPEVDAWVMEMLYYTPDSHTGDRLMASWFAREGVRLSAVRAEVGYININAR